MRKLLLSVLFIVLAAPAAAQMAPEVRKQQIVANLLYQLPQLQQFEIDLSDLEPAGFPGLERGAIIIPGQQPLPFVITSDNSQLYLLATDPVDVSRTSAELSMLQAERDAAEAAAATERHQALLAVVEGLPVRGNPDAPVTVVEFSDFQCPYCARAAETVDELLEQRPSDVRFVFAHFPLPNHPWAKPASIAALCAGEQSEAAYWTLHDAYFEDQQAFSTSNVIEKSRALLEGEAVDLDTWAVCAADDSSAEYQEASATVDQLVAAGRQFGVTGTPGFFVNGAFASGAQPLPALEAMVDAALER